MVALDMKKSVSVQVDSDFALLLPEGLYEIKKMEPRSRQRSIVVACVFLAIAGMIIFGYFCNDQVQNSLDGNAEASIKRALRKLRQQKSCQT